MMMLALADRAKLARILALLASDQPGEVVAAAHAANRMVKAAGLSWSDVLTGMTERPGAGTFRQPTPPPYQSADHTADLRACCQRPDLLTAWEVQFVTSLARQSRVTPRQRETLAGIAVRVRRAGPRAG